MNISIFFLKQGSTLTFFIKKSARVIPCHFRKRKLTRALLRDMGKKNWGQEGGAIKVNVKKNDISNMEMLHIYHLTSNTQPSTPLLPPPTKKKVNSQWRLNYKKLEIPFT